MALIPARHAYEKLAHMCALNRFCANRFLQLGGIDKLVEDGLLSVPPDSPEAATTAEFLPAFCALHDARDRVRHLGGCQALADMLGVPGGPELDETRIRAAAAAAELCVGNNANREFFTSACMGHLMALMAAESQHLQEAAIGALAEMAEGSEACKAAASAHGVVGVLLMATMVHNQRVQVPPTPSPKLHFRSYTRYYLNSGVGFEASEDGSTLLTTCQEVEVAWRML